MVLKGKAKEVWWRFRQIRNSKDIPLQLDAVYAIDSAEDDDYIFHIVEYVKVIDEVFLKGTNNTDRTALYLAGLTRLKKLTLSRNPAITRDALSSISRITTLEYLDLTGTAVETTDLSALGTLDNLREIHLTTAIEDTELILRQLASFQERHPGCSCWVNYQAY